MTRIILSSQKDVVKYRHIAGIYRFRNKINNKSYVGQSVTIGKRINEHLCALRHSDRQYSIHKAILKYGIENFEIEVLATFENCENLHKILNEAEQIYICFYDSFKCGYNETAGGDSMHKRKWTEEQKEHMKKVLIGRKRPSDYIDPRSKPVYFYHIKTERYYYAHSAGKASIEIDSTLSPTQIQACVKNKHFTTNGYICAYSEEELEHKINLFKQNKVRCRLK